jgi:DNA-binding transcriptional MerR regulator
MKRSSQKTPEPTPVYRMKDLCELVGMPRQAIHFYIKEGLVPEGTKTGRNTATYGPEHVERLRLVKKLQEERFLPLKAIKEIVAPSNDGDGEGGARDTSFTPSQRELLAELKRRFATRLGPLSTASVAHRVFVDAAPLLRRLGVTRAELDEIALTGMLTVDERGRVARDDVFILETWAALKQAGFSPARGFSPLDFRIYARVVEALVRDEAGLLAERLAGRPADEIVEMLERALPIANQFLTRYHEKLARAFLARQ